MLFHLYAVASRYSSICILSQLPTVVVACVVVVGVDDGVIAVLFLMLLTLALFVLVLL